MKTKIPASRINSEKRRRFWRSSGARLASSGSPGEGKPWEELPWEELPCEELGCEGIDLVTAALGLVARNRDSRFSAARN
jgi:hypothetical protein